MQPLERCIERGAVNLDGRPNQSEKLNQCTTIARTSNIGIQHPINFIHLQRLLYTKAMSYTIEEARTFLIQLKLIQIRHYLIRRNLVDPVLNYSDLTVRNYFLIDSTSLIFLLVDEGGLYRLRLHV